MYIKTNEFTPNPRDHFRLYARQYYRRIRWINRLFMGIAVIAVGAIIIQRGEIAPIQDAIMLIVLLALVRLTPLIVVWIRMPQQRPVTRHYDSDDTFIMQYNSDGTIIKNRFEYVSDILITKKYYFLFFNRRDFFDVQRSTFANQEDINKFEAILHNHKLLKK